MKKCNCAKIATRPRPWRPPFHVIGSGPARGWRRSRRSWPASARSTAARLRSATDASSSPARKPTCRRRCANAKETIACEGRWITPGLIDCHTHLVYAGNRAGEFELRLRGASYEEIARAGGGIVSSVKALRAASEDELVARALPRLDALIGEGVTTVEIKSGYGLDLPNERKSLRAAGAWAANGRCRSGEPFSAPTRCRPSSRATRRLYRGDRDDDPARPRRAKGWPTRSTAFARASRSRRRRSRACSRPRARSACR